jgi:hypothetical protein
MGNVKLELNCQLKIYRMFNLQAALDTHFVIYAYHSTVTKGASVQVSFFNDFFSFFVDLKLRYSARRFMGSRIIESAAYCNQILLAQLYLNSAKNTSVN